MTCGMMTWNEYLGDRGKFVFSPDVILCGWLGSKHQLTNYFVIQGKKTVLNRLHVGHSYLTHSFISNKEEPPVCVACNAVITVKYILLECVHLMEIRNKYFEENSLYSLFLNVIPEIILISCERLVCFTKYEVC